MFYTASLISRPKLNLCGTHYGVHIDDNTVIDPQREGIKIISKTDFANGFPVSLESSRQVTPNELPAIKEKIGQFKYDLIDHNCEHFSRDVVENKRESRQIKFLIVAGLTLFVLWLMTRE